MSEVLTGGVVEPNPVLDSQPGTTGQHHKDGRVRGSAAPVEGRCGRKLRNSDPPRYCTRWPLKGKTACQNCGGLSPGGIASPHFKNGERSKYLKDLPNSLRAGYKAALADESLLSLRDELAVLETRARELLRGMEARPPPPWVEMQLLAKQLQSDDPATKQQAVEAILLLSEKGATAARTYETHWAKLLDVIDRKTKVAAAEWRRMTELSAVVTVDEALTLVKAFMVAARDTVTDAAMLQAFQRRVTALLPTPVDKSRQ